MKAFSKQGRNILLTLTLLVLINTQIISNNDVVVPKTLDRETLSSILDKIDELIFDVPDQIDALEIRKLLRAMFHDYSLGCDASISRDSTYNRGL